MDNLVVLKFGGTSVSSLERWITIASVLKERLKNNERPLLVCSALSGISNLLEEMIKEAPNENPISLIEKFKEKHNLLANDLSLKNTDFLQEAYIELENYMLGASLTKEVSPKLHAKILSLGERLSTKMGAAFLNEQKLKVRWQDVREILTSESSPLENPHSHYKSSLIKIDSQKVPSHLFENPDEIIITQGFIAKDLEGDTVLLGRGGSDTSGAYLAAILNAKRLEIWTDVPGLYTANPRDIPSARLLKSLNYHEAQEMATTGAKVLHPRCLAPVKKKGIPLHICCTSMPEIEGTIIEEKGQKGLGQMKSLSLRKNVTLISVENFNMWREVGFLAKLFSIFKNHGLSIDLLSTSETNVTLSLDAEVSAGDPKIIQAVMKDLNTLGEAKTLGPCAAISLVGHNVRSNLPKLGPILKVFEDKRVYLMSQASSDLNLTFVVDEDEGIRLVRELHSYLFDNIDKSEIIGPRYEETFSKLKIDYFTDHRPWWQQPEKEEKLLKLAEKKSPLYVYDEEKILEKVAILQNLSHIDEVFFAIKANSHPEILKTLEKKGLGLECVSQYEVDFIFQLFPKISPERIIFSPNFAPKDEYENALKKGVHLIVDNSYPLYEWPELFSGKSIILRIDPGQGRGHHDFVKTAGKNSKFGILPEDLPKLKEHLSEHQIKVKGLHVHSGSNINHPDYWKEMAIFLLKIRELFQDVTFFNLGGGLFVPSKSGEAFLNLDNYNEALTEVKKAHPEIKIWIEPGRFLVAEAGVLLAKVTQLKEKEGLTYIGVNAGMNSFIRPALYGAYHNIFNLSKWKEQNEITATVVGPICESGDTFGRARPFPQTKAYDVILFETTGAYGKVMGSNYNMRPIAEEVFLPHLL